MFWSEERGTALRLRQSTARESPRLATYIVRSCTMMTHAVVPDVSRPFRAFSRNPRSVSRKPSLIPSTRSASLGAALSGRRLSRRLPLTAEERCQPAERPMLKCMCLAE